jgi:holo-[acyl-carrier protein] synthase
MILGLGSDIVDIRRIEATLERFGEKFLARVFTDAERARAERRAENPKVRAGTYAKRFAAKEAASKALGTGFRHGVFWRDLAVVNLPGGKPTMRLSGGAAIRLAQLTPMGFSPAIDLTMTDEYPYAQAMVVISAAPRAAAGVDSGATGGLQAALTQGG